MPTELLIFIAAAVAANVLVLAAVVALSRDRRPAANGNGLMNGLNGNGQLLPAPRPPETPSKYAPPIAPAIAREGPIAYQRVLRILWWLTTIGILVGVGVSGAFPETQALIFVLGGAAAVAVLVLHELIPERWRAAGPKFWVEALVAVGLIAALLALTGYGRSPFFFTFPLVAVAVALARGGKATFFFAALASLAYLAVLAADPERAAFAPPDLLRFGVNIGSIWILAYLAGVFAAQERRVRARVLQLSVTDPLTGLFNRAQTYATVDAEIRRTRRSERGFCLLMIDLDGLKGVNDSLGHHRGDEVLRSLGRVILSSIRTVDTAYRYGGDEFVILLPETEITGAYVVAEKIRTGVEEIEIALAEEELAASVSIGLVSHPEDGQMVEELMIAADRAMYAAKAMGKNQISGYPRPRRTTPSLPPLAAEPAVEKAPVAPPAAAPAAGRPMGPGIEPTEAAAGVSAAPPPVVPEPLGPAAVAPSAPVGPGPIEDGNAGAAEATESEELTPAEARRRIAALSYDPDHQIRRAMDAFLGAPVLPEDQPKGH